MSKIETGVDRLVELIGQQKRISIDDAAKNLGVSKVVVQEWADFLEEEKIISIDYKFSKTFLVERKLSETEIKVKEKEYSSEKDAFVRKVETSLKNLDNDSAGLEKIKSEFEEINKNIGGELDKVKAEVKELEKYDFLKKNLDKEIEKQIEEFHSLLDKSHKNIDEEQKRHQILLQSLEIEKRDVQLKQHRLLDLEEKEKEIMTRLQGIFDLSKDLEKRVAAEKSSITSSETKLFEIEKAARGIENNILKKKDEIQPLLDKANKHEQQILKIQDDILEKARKKTESIKSKAEEGTKVINNFESFFQKKSDVDTMIKKIETEKKDMESSFKLLGKKALAFDLATKSNTVGTQVRELEKELQNINSKKAGFKADLEKLIKLVKG